MSTIAFDAHQVTYLTGLGWFCTCGEEAETEDDERAQRMVAFHLWFTKGDFDPFGGDDARIALGQYTPPPHPCAAEGHLSDGADTCVRCWEPLE